MGFTPIWGALLLILDTHSAVERLGSKEDHLEGEIFSREPGSNETGSGK